MSDISKKISLDSILLLILGFYFLYRQNVDILFYVIFFVLIFVYIYSDSIIRQKTKDVVKKYLLFLIIGLLISITLIPLIGLRAANPNQYMPHDNIVQIEAAADYLLAGKNPYTQNYLGTPLERQAFVRTTLSDTVINPALYHCVKLPWHLVSAIPFKLLSQWLLGFYDQRILYLILYSVSLFVVYSLPKHTADKRLFTVLYALNPLFINFFVAGRGDVFVFTWLILTIYYLQKQRLTWSSIMLGLACVSKHSAWLFVPFYILYVYWQQQNLYLNWKQNLKSLIKLIYPAAIVFLIFIVPFLIWDLGAFWQDIYQYPSGSLMTSYHINGYGFSMLLYSLGIIETIHSLYPAWIFQLPLGLLLFYFIYRQQKKNNSLSQILVGYGLFIFVFWFFSRFFHDNYIGYLSMVFLGAYFISSDKTLSPSAI